MSDTGVCPLFVELAIMVYCRPPSEWPKHQSWESPAGKRVRAEFEELRMTENGRKGPAMDPYIRAVCRVNMPVMRYVIPGEGL